jgi:membrane protein YqaA with SNARE-associated domain
MENVFALLGALAFCLFGGLLPWFNTEAAVGGAALLLPPSALPALVVGAAGAQVIAKGALYGLARWAPRSLPRRARGVIESLSVRMARRRLLGLTVLASSSVGVPPFYVTALACGTLAAPAGPFLSAAFAGALLRYAFVCLAALLVKGAL